jgi:hypothetical protein
MVKRIVAPANLIIAAFIFLLGFLAGSPALFAQGTPAVDPAYPAHIHEGTCAELGAVVYPLESVTPLGVDAAPVATAEMQDASPEAMAVDGTPVGSESVGEGQVVAESTTIVEASLDDIMGAEHAVNVHESAENIDVFIACGDITGEMTDESLLIELQELNDSGYSGEAVLTDNGDGTTTVTVTLMQMDGAATPEASPIS